jgi:hypothetical protein
MSMFLQYMYYVISVIAKIFKYRGFCDKHHFILMVMEVHNIFEHDMDRLITSVLVFLKPDNRGSFIFVFFYSIFQAMC